MRRILSLSAFLILGFLGIGLSPLHAGSADGGCFCFGTLGPAYMEYGPGYMNYGPDYMQFGPDYMLYGPGYMNYGPDYMQYGPDYMQLGPDYMQYGPDFGGFGICMGACPSYYYSSPACGCGRNCVCGTHRGLNCTCGGKCNCGTIRPRVTNYRGPAK